MRPSASIFFLVLASGLGSTPAHARMHTATDTNAATVPETSTGPGEFPASNPIVARAAALAADLDREDPNWDWLGKQRTTQKSVTTTEEVGIVPPAGENGKSLPGHAIKIHQNGEKEAISGDASSGRDDDGDPRPEMGETRGARVPPAVRKQEHVEARGTRHTDGGETHAGKGVAPPVGTGGVPLRK
jgi:hypothetical protein